MGHVRRLGAVALGLSIPAALGIRRWKHGRMAALTAESELVRTSEGVIEVARHGAGYPLLVLHGAPGGYDQALIVGREMLGDGYEVIAPSRPGYLRTPLQGNPSPGDQAKMLVGLLDELDVETALVAGISAGGPVGLQLAAEYPERVAGVILGAPVTVALEDEFFGIGVPLVDALLLADPFLDLQSALMAGFLRVSPESVLESMLQQVSTLEGEALEAYASDIRADPEQWTRFQRLARSFVPSSPRKAGTRNDEYWLRALPLFEYESIAVPLLLVHGEYDAAVPLAHAEYVAERVPDAELLTVEADHFAMLGPDADRAADAVRSFAHRVAAPPDSTV